MNMDMLRCSNTKCGKGTLIASGPGASIFIGGGGSMSCSICGHPMGILKDSKEINKEKI